MAKPSTKGQFLLVEESLRSRSGHYFQFALSLKNSFGSTNHQFDGFGLACHAKSDASVLKTFDAEPVFPSSRLEKPCGRLAKLSGQARFIFHNIQFYFALKRVLEKRKVGFFFLPTASHYHLWAILALQRLHPKIATRCCVFLVQQPTSWPHGRLAPVADKIAPVLRSQLRGFQKLIADNRTIVAVETPRAQQEYEELFGGPVRLLPHPVEVPTERAIGSKENTVTFASFGFARHEKGSDILVEALSTCLAEPFFDDCVFIIQWGNDFPMPDGSTMTLPDEIREHNRVSVIDEAMDETEYEAMLKVPTALILPYRKSSYYGRLSRVSIEAASTGIPMIVTPETHLQDVVESQGAGIIIEDETSAALVKGMREFLENRSRLVSEAMKRAAKARTYNSPETFISLLTKE